MIIKPKIRGFICTTTHPVGCEANVKEQIAYTKAQGPIKNAPKRVLVVDRLAAMVCHHASLRRLAVVRRRSAYFSKSRALTKNQVLRVSTMQQRLTS